MSINVVFKKSVMPLLIIAAIILSMFTTSNRVHAMSEPNLALNLNPNTTELSMIRQILVVKLHSPHPCY
ncbi:MAG: hypothetical protein JWM44_3903 [Bacilli bacterium]|nr:hypothetical protein [Bacilli bacterium]